MKPILAPGRILRPMLVASLAINIFFAAFLGAQYWHSRTDLPSLAGGSGITPSVAFTQMVLQKVADALPADDRAVLRQALLSHAPALRGAQQDYLDAIDAARQEVARTPLDPAALKASVDAAVAARQKMAPIIGTLLADAILHMSAEGRRILSTQGPGQ